MSIISLILALYISFLAYGQVGTSSFRYEGKLTGPGVTGTMTNQQFRADIRRPDCPSQSLGLSVWQSTTVQIVDGVFSITPTFSASDLSRAMNPSGTFGSCPAGVIAERILQVEWNDGSGWVSFAVPLADAPRAALALNTNSIGGTSVNPNLSCTNGMILQWDMANSRLNCAALASGDVPPLDANKITSGTVDVSRLPSFGATSDLTGTVDTARVVKIQGTQVSTVAPTTGQVLKYSGSQWIPAADATIPSVMTTNLDMGTFNLTNATSLASTNVSTRNLVLADADSDTVTIKSPTNVTTTFSLTLPAAQGGSGQILTNDGSGNLSWTSPAAGITASQYASDVSPAAACTDTQTPYWNTIADTWACQNINIAGAGGFFVDGGNSFSSPGVLGTNDPYALAFKVNNAIQATLQPDGKFGLGTFSPVAKLDINGDFNIRGQSVPPSPSAGHARLYYDGPSQKLKFSENAGPFRTIASESASNTFSQKQTFANGAQIGSTGSELQKIILCNPTITLGTAIGAFNSTIAPPSTCAGAEIGMIPKCSLNNPGDTDVEFYSFDEVTVTVANEIRMKIINNTNTTRPAVSFSFQCILFK